MKTAWAIFALLFAGFPLAAVAEDVDAHDVYGVWLTHSQTARVEIKDCGDGTPCGNVVWIDPDSLEDGVTPETAIDLNNPEESLRSRAILGLRMLSDFRKRNRDWRNGRIYDPEVGKTYGARLKRLDTDELQLKGCIGPICQTQIWKKAELAG